MPVQARRLRVAPSGPDFLEHLRGHGVDGLRRAETRTLQVNVGRRCNQACHHCHVDAGPKRTETMSPAVAARVLELLAGSDRIDTLDITGGAPELCASFRGLVRGGRALGKHVIDRCNLTILLEPGEEDLAGFLAGQGVHVVASLPCYQPTNVDRQRGRGVFDRSIQALRRLNDLGYGRPGSGLVLDLVYNPLGPSLPPPQGALEARYKLELGREHGVVFDRLLTITNVPIRRFADELVRGGNDAAYRALLVDSFQRANLDGLMCRHLISVGWDGRLFDCDFNQMLDLPAGGRPRTIFEVGAAAELDGEPIATESHCFACTAGAGSSCGGALS